MRSHAICSMFSDPELVPVCELYEGAGPHRSLQIEQCDNSDGPQCGQ